MLDANNYTFLIQFKNTFNNSFIVNTQVSNNGLSELAQALKERRKTGTQNFDVYQFDKSKRKFLKITREKFILLTSFHTELNVILTDLYK